MPIAECRMGLKYWGLGRFRGRGVGSSVRDREGPVILQAQSNHANWRATLRGAGRACEERLGGSLALQARGNHASWRATLRGAERTCKERLGGHAAP